VNGDIELEIGPGSIAGSYAVRVMRAAAGGEPTGTLELDVEELLGRRETLEATLLASAVARRSGAPAERPVQEVGQQLFEALFTGPVYGMYRASLGVARQQGKRLRVVLRLTVPELAAVPWEMLFDPETGTYLCRQEPLVRHVPAPYTVDPVDVRSPLRVLGLVASPRGLPKLDVEAEKDHLAQALATPIADGLVEVVWVPEATWDGVHALLLAEEWHVLHFVGHGDYSAQADEGVLALVGADGRAEPVEASRLADLLGEAQPSPRLVVLNSCSSGRTGVNDLFSGTAAALVRSGISAVAAMQFTISDAAAIAFARGFYTAIAHGRDVDDAARSGRIAILGAPHSLEWVTPVLYVRGQGTQLFTLTKSPASKSKGAPARQKVARAAPSEPTSPKESPARAEPPHSQQYHGVGVSSVKATHGEGAAAIGQETPARPDGRRRSSILRSFTRTRAARAAIAALAIAMVGVVIALFFPFGSRPGWPYDTGSAVYAQPVIVNGVVYVGSTDGRVYALNAGTGAVRWQFPQAGKPAIGAVYASPGIAGNIVYVGSDDGRIYALKDTTGAPAWSKPCNKPGDRVRSSPVFVDGVVYATSGSGYVCAMRAASGARYWNPVWIGPGAPGSSPTVAPNTPGTSLNPVSIYVGSGDGHVYALNASSGATRWQFPPKGQPGIGIIDSQSADGSVLYAASSGAGGHLYALAAGTGRILWEYPGKNQPGIGAIDSQPAVASDGSAIYFASGFDVYALDTSSGTPLPTWKADPAHLPNTINLAGPQLGTDAVYVGSGKLVECLNLTSGVRCWKQPFTADDRVVSTPAVNGSNGNIYFGTLDGKVYALNVYGWPANSH
jgi:outer membrane protein assembly factor BamB